MDSFSDVFERVKQLCRGEMSEVAYDLWIRELELTALDSSTACLQCTTQFKRDIVNEKYNALLTASFEEIMGFPVQVEITSREAAPAAPAAQENNRLDFQPEKEYSFETFVVGSGNSLAHAAAWAVANNPAKSYNPLFMYGGSGLGKTHLLYAICNEIKKNTPDVKIIYTKGEYITNELIEAIQKGQTMEFRAKYRQVDVLLVDDIQFISGKVSTQEEFFHTFNALHAAHKQIILSSDKPPKEMETLEDRLRTRFEMGLLADIQPPDLETRIAIIKRKAQLLDFNISDDICEYIANQLKSNVRQLEGAVKRMRAQCLLGGEQPTLLTAQNAIRDIRNDNQPVPITVEKIINEVARTMNVTPEDIPDALDFASVDVSFISLTKILIPARNLLKTGGQMVCLIKPQFEAGRGKVGKNGVVREPQIHEEVIRKIIDYADSIGFEVLHLEYSPIKGPEGNIEYLLHIRKPEETSEEKLALTEHEAESALQTIIEEKTGLSYTPEWDAVIKGIVDNSHTL